MGDPVLQGGGRGTEAQTRLDRRGEETQPDPVSLTLIPSFTRSSTGRARRMADSHSSERANIHLAPPRHWTVSPGHSSKERTGQDEQPGTPAVTGAGRPGLEGRGASSGSSCRMQP